MKKEYLDFISIYKKYNNRIKDIVRFLYKHDLCYETYEKCDYNDKTINIDTSTFAFDEDDGRYLKSIVLPFEVLFSDDILNEIIEYKELETELKNGVKDPWPKEKLTKYLTLEDKYKL